MPVLLTRREPDHVTRADLLDRSALTLHPAASGGNHEGLPKGVRVPRGTAPGSKVTKAPPTRAGSGDANSGSIRTDPLNQSAAPLPEG